MNRLIATTLCMLSLLGMSGCSQPTPATTIYSDKTGGYEIRIPQGWNITRGYGDVDLLLTPAHGDLTVRAAILHDAPKQARTAPQDLDDYVAFRRPRLGHFASQRTLMSDESRAMNTHHPLAHLVEYEYETGPKQQVHTRAWLLSRGGHGYTLMLSAPPAVFDDWEAQWKQLETSFRVE